MAEEFQRKDVVPRTRKLVREAEKPVTLTPSAFQKEMALSTEQSLASTRERRWPQISQLLDINGSSCHKFSTADVKQSLFRPSPPEVVFENYVPCEVYEAPLVLRNRSMVPQLVKVVMESSPYFKLISPSDVDCKVSPGMPSTFRIIFTPEENKDYFHQLICITEREKFIVPIWAKGPRAVLDFPNQLNFSVCPVKHSTKQTLLVRNTGNREACYSISTQSPFSVDPSTGTLGIGDAMQVTVEFHPLQTGNHSGSLRVHYDTGEDTHTSLYGEAKDVNIRLDRSSLTVEKTYLTQSKRSSVVIHNQSDIVAHFQWKTFSTEEEDDVWKLRLQRKEEGETVYILKDCVVDPTLLSGTFQNQRAEVREGSMLFPDDIFTIEPVEGDVWPHSSVEVTVTFKPREERVYQRVFCCDISGRETRPMLRVKGEGRGPWLRFDCDQLDIGKVFVGSANSCEAILFNKGAIDGVFHLVPTATALDSCFTVLPHEGIIVPGGLQVIQISFSSTILGQFTKEFRFNVDGSPEPVTLIISGCVIGPTFHFDVPSLDFGDVSFGFPHTLLCRLTNTSSVPITVSLHIPGDGSGVPSITCCAQMLDNTLQFWRKGAQGHVRPTEFTVIPCRRTIPALGFLDIEVTLCSNTVKVYNLALMVDEDSVGKEVLALPLTARCVVPPVRVLNPIVSLGRCFLKLPYEQTVTLVNDSDLPGCYRILPQDRKEDAAVWYSSPLPCGVIWPHSTVEVPLILESQVMGKKHAVAHVAVFGSEEPPLEIHLLSTGEGPVVSVHPAEINFGKVKVLQDASQTFHLSNHSLIPASFWAETAGKRSCWRIEPSKGVIPPDSKVSVAVIANLDDAEKFEDEVKLFIENSWSCIIPVRAVGIGTTIVTDLPFAPELNLGPHFSLFPCSYRFKITNKGRYTQRLSWTTEGFAPFCQCDHPAISDTKGKDSSQCPKPTCPVFNLQPSRMELMPGKTMEVMLEGFSSTPQVVKERLLCHAFVGRRTEKVQVMQVDVTCEFVVPILHVSPREIIFRVEKQLIDVLTLQYKPLSLKNVCCLPVSVVLALEEPFFICSMDQQPFPADFQPVKLETGEEFNLSIGFNPAYKEDLNFRVAEKALKIQFLEHPHEEHITVRVEVQVPNLHFPTTVLDFGCILNDTEAKRSIEMTNCSELPVRYHWSFLADSSMIQMSTPGPRLFAKCMSLKEGGTWLEHSASAGRRARGAEEAAEAPRAARDPAQEPVDADDSLEAKVFNILPKHGVLQPGKSQEVTFTFFGHADIIARVTALCSVEGGPTHEMVLSGEALRISYLLDTTKIDCGLQLFNKVTEAKVTLQNSGKVGFVYVVLSPSTGTADSLLPGVPLVLPSMGYVGPGKEQMLKVRYLPAVPGVFYGTFQIQVDHLEPVEISLKGVTSFPRICLNLPRNIKGNEKYEKVLKEAKEKMEEDSQKDKATVPREAVAKEPSADDLDPMLDTQLLMKMEQMLIEKHALEQQMGRTFVPWENTALDLCAHQRLLNAQLPEYILDFGDVVPSNVRTRDVEVTNPGQCPVSFRPNRHVLGNTGFSVELDCMKKPLPCCETATFKVHFDPQSANLPPGEVEVRLPIKVAGGPTFHILLCANVAASSLCLSRDKLNFSTVQCGQCQEETVQLHNHLRVPCEWCITRSEPVKKVDKPLPGSKRQKPLQGLKAKPCAFEVLPLTGTLAPGQRCNVQVRFSPTEEKSYRTKLEISTSQSRQPLQLQVSGHGVEPRLEFSPAMLELGPLLPDGSEVEGTVVVKNLCQFPIEFYSLEFDQQYLAEEEVLRMLKEYDCHNTLLLPPRTPGEKLPQDVLEYYQDQKRLEDQQANSKTEEPADQDKGEGSALAVLSVDTAAEHWQSTASSKGATEEVDDGPVSRAIARHLGIDISAEGRAARNRRGVFIIVHGAPLTGKTSAAVALSKYYGAACLSINTVVREALFNSDSSAAFYARDLCFKAAVKRSHGETEAGQNAGSSHALQSGAKAKHGSNTSRRRASVQSGGSQGRQNTPVDKKSVGAASQSKPYLHQGLSSAMFVSGLRRMSVYQQLSTHGSSAEEIDFMSCVLPEEVLVDILSERLQLRDCYQGVVFDGLETVFASSTASALFCLLKAASNRPHIYFVDLVQDYADLKAREKAAKEQEEQEKKEAARREGERFWEMTEEDYDALTEEEKTWFDNLIREVQRERKKRWEMEQLARDQLVCLRKEKPKEMSKSVKKVCFSSKDNASQKKSRPGVRQERPAGLRYSLATRLSKEAAHHRDAQHTRKEPRGLPDMKRPTSKNASTRSHLDTTEGADRKTSARRHSVAFSEDEERKKKQTEVPLMDVSCICPQGSHTKAFSDSEENLIQRFQNYEASRKNVARILSSWDRAHAILLRPQNQEELCHQGKEKCHSSSSHRDHRNRKKEWLEKEQLKKPKGQVEDDEESSRGQAVGVPCFDIQVPSCKDVTERILESGKLPAAEQILDVLGLGPSGPPIPPTTFYSVIHYPAKRSAPAAETLEHFTFVVPEGATAGDSEENLESAVDTPVTPTLVPSPERTARLSSCRWIVPACGEVELKVCFSSMIVGQFDQTLHFEVLGTKRLYRLHCRGTCLYPTISQDPRVVFPRQRKRKAAGVIIWKEYVMNTGVFHFGPLLCGKSRDGYKALLHPGNCEKITIQNITPLAAEVRFSFHHDANTDTFLLDPPSMRLQPNEKQELTVWAYPTSAGLIEDNLICCIDNNPEPVVFPLCCQGVRVELGVSPKQVQFGKVLLYRTASKTLVLQNSTPLPMAWRLSGLENLSKDFSVSANAGIVDPRTEFGVHLCFKATTPCTVKKMIQLAVSDADNILGTAQVENIQIQAEAYDISLSINIPKGGDGIVDFGIIKVLDEEKQMLTLKNTGKYKVAYSFRLETAGTKIQDLASHFTIEPQKGVLAVSKQPVQVQLLFHPKKGMNIEAKPILCCEVIDPSIGEVGETVDTIVMRVSAKAAYSEYSINPASLIDFGAMRKDTCKTCTFTLENKGVLGFKFHIFQADPDVGALRRKSAHRQVESGDLTKGAPLNEQTKSLVPKDTDPVLQDRITLGMFTVYPGFGSVPPGGQQIITVDCHAEPLGTCKEHLSISISNRAPRDHPRGIPYTLLAESCLPAFEVDNVESIFEEHRICSSSDLQQSPHFVQEKSVFITDENKFIFIGVLPGHQATARFKICNVGRVPCEVVLSVKLIARKGSGSSLKPNSSAKDIFKVDPPRMCVPSDSHAFATVTFSPYSMQNYQCTFKASLDIRASPPAVPPQSLTFDISGEGHLPRVTVLRPRLHSKRGNPLLLFKKVLLGSSAELPLVLRNSGLVPVQLMIDLLDEGGVFFLKARPTTHCIYQAADVKEDSPGEGTKPHTASLVLCPGESAEFDVLFKPTLAQHTEGKIHLSVVGSPYGETDIQLVGEGYEDVSTLDDTHGLVGRQQERH